MFTFGGIYAAGVLNWSVVDTGVFGILAIITGTIFAWVGGRADSRFGPKPVIITCVLVLTAVALAVVFVSRESVFGIAVDADSNKPLAFPVSEAQEDFVRHADFREDPLLNALGTASGKFELYSVAIERYGYDDCPPHATWMEPIERLGGPSTKYPLHLAANHPQMRLHSQLCGTVNRETYEIAEREPCWMNPEDAEQRGLADGDVVRVFNDRGQLLAGLKITDEIMPGVVRINEGGWFDPANPREIGSLCAYGDVNILTTGIATSKLAQGNCGHTGVAEVERYDGPLPKVTVFSQPSA